jgi:hypothetical protein
MGEKTLATGYFNEPLHQPPSEALLTRFPNLRALPPFQAKPRLWEPYCSLTCAGRAEFVKQAICPATRNLTDDQLGAIGETRGMVALNFHVGFLRPDGELDQDAPLELLVRHIDHVAEIADIDCVGPGADSPYIAGPHDVSWRLSRTAAIRARIWRRSCTGIGFGSCELPGANLLQHLSSAVAVSRGCGATSTTVFFLVPSLQRPSVSPG